MPDIFPILSGPAMAAIHHLAGPLDLRSRIAERQADRDRSVAREPEVPAGPVEDRRPQARGRDSRVPRPRRPHRGRHRAGARDRCDGRVSLRARDLLRRQGAAAGERHGHRRYAVGRRRVDHDDAGGALQLHRRGRTPRVSRHRDRLRPARAGHADDLFRRRHRLFGDMKMIGEIYRPEIAFLPIGDHYTMGPDTAALAATLARRAPGRADALGHVPAAHGNGGCTRTAARRHRHRGAQAPAGRNGEVS